MYFAFLVVMLFVAVLLVLTRTSQHKLLSFLVCGWILTCAVFDGHFATIPLGSLSFDMRGDRVLLLLFAAYVLLRWTFGIRPDAARRTMPRWFSIGLLYLGLLALVDVIHLSRELSFRELVINVTVEGTFFLVLYVVAVTVDDRMARVVGWSLMLVCAVSSLIGIYQFFGDPMFFRYGVARPAFAGFVRANGVFSADHVQAYWLIAGLSVVLLTVRRKALRIVLEGLFVTGLILTFHRMSWIVFSILMLAYLARVRKVTLVTWWSAATAVAGMVVLLSATSLVETFGKTAFVRERLTQGTGGYRVLFTAIALTSVPDHPVLGVGTAKSTTYYSTVRAEGLSEQEARGEYGGIHNTYLQLAYFKGVPVALVFVAFLLLGIKGLWKVRPDESAYAYVGFTEILKFALAGMTNGLMLGSQIGILMAILVGVGVGMGQRYAIDDGTLGETVA